MLLIYCFLSDSCLLLVCFLSVSGDEKRIGNMPKQQICFRTSSQSISCSWLVLKLPPIVAHETFSILSPLRDSLLEYLDFKISPHPMDGPSYDYNQKARSLGTKAPKRSTVPINLRYSILFAHPSIRTHSLDNFHS